MRNLSLGAPGRVAAAVLAAVACSAAFAAGDGPATTEFQLGNGLKVIVKEDHRAPTAAEMVWYRAGSVDESGTVTGVAHVLEHMMFKGTASIGPGEFSKRVAALGGRENAFTNRDYTAYFQMVEKSRLPDVMALEADRMAHLVLSKAEFDKEIQVVMEERRLRTDDVPEARFGEQMMAQAFTATPVRHPVIGWMSDLERMSYLDAQDWYRRWYAPNNAVLIVVGDVDPAQVKALAERNFGAIPKRALPPRVALDDTAQHGQRRFTLQARAENPILQLAWKAPTLRKVDGDDDVYALAVLAAVLSGYDNARLPRELVRQQRIALSAEAGYDYSGRGPSLFVLEASPAPGVSPDTLEAALRAQVARIAEEGITPAELARIKAQILASRIYARDSLMGQAMEIGTTEMSGFSWRDIDRILDRLQAVDPQRVRDVARRYFGDAQLTVGLLQPEAGTAPAMPAALRAAPSAGALR